MYENNSYELLQGRRHDLQHEAEHRRLVRQVEQKRTQSWLRLLASFIGGFFWLF